MAADVVGVAEAAEAKRAGAAAEAAATRIVSVAATCPADAAAGAGERMAVSEAVDEPAVGDMSEQEIAFQALVYRHVSVLLRYPDKQRGEQEGAPDQAASARELAALFTEDAREHKLASAMARDAEKLALLEMQRDYTALFIGALEMLAVPYASYWLDGKRQLGGPTTIAVQKAYAACGMTLAEQRKQPGDHLATMLEFLFALLREAAMSAQSDVGRCEQLVVQARAFFASYVAPWVEEMGALVVAHAKTSFYKSLGELLALVLVEDSLLVLAEQQRACDMTQHDAEHATQSAPHNGMQNGMQNGFETLKER